MGRALSLLILSAFWVGVTSQEQQHHHQVQLLSETPVLGTHWDFILWLSLHRVWL